MKNIIPAALLGMILLTSCSSMYRTGQTPDDVYFSPARPATENVRTEREDTRDEYAYTEPDNNYLRMKVQNRNRWNTINDADYWYSYNRPYQYTHNNYNWNTWSYGYNSYPFWNNNFNYGYNNYGNPYYYNKGYYGYQPGTIVRNLRSNTGPKPYMGGQTNTNYNNRNYGSGKSSSLGNTLRNVFTPNNNTNTRTTTNSSGDTYSNPVRTFTPSTPSTSTPSSSSGNSSSGRSSGGTNSGGGRAGRGN